MTRIRAVKLMRIIAVGYHVAHHAGLHDRDTRLWLTLEFEWHSARDWVRVVVEDRNVRWEICAVETFAAERGALVVRLRRKMRHQVHEQLAKGGRFENDGPCTGINSLRFGARECLCNGSFPNRCGINCR